MPLAQHDLFWPSCPGAMQCMRCYLPGHMCHLMAGLPSCGSKQASAQAGWHWQASRKGKVAVVVWITVTQTVARQSGLSVLPVSSQAHLVQTLLGGQPTSARESAPQSPTPTRDSVGLWPCPLLPARALPHKTSMLRRACERVLRTCRVSVHTYPWVPRYAYPQTRRGFLLATGQTLAGKAAHQPAPREQSRICRASATRPLHGVGCLASGNTTVG